MSRLSCDCPIPESGTKILDTCSECGATICKACAGDRTVRVCRGCESIAKRGAPRQPWQHGSLAPARWHLFAEDYNAATWARFAEARRTARARDAAAFEASGR
jgi:NMD protein affecting ribosome stability and mRNA decay